MNRPTALLALPLALLCACASPQGAAPPGDVADAAALDAASDRQTPDVDGIRPELPVPSTLWDPGAAIPDLPAWITDHLEPHGISTWSFALEHDGAPPEHMHLADYAVGNGQVFSLIGHALPFNTLHSMIGPDYQKDDGYFSDLWIEVASGPAAQALTWKREWIGRARRAPVVITHAEGAVVGLTTVDVAPPGVPGLLRIIVVRNRSAEVLDGLWIRAACARPQTDLGDGAVREERGGNLRDLRWMSGGDAVAGATSLGVAVGPLAPGAVAVLQLAAGTGIDADGAQAANEALGQDPAELIAGTLAAWDDRLSAGTEISTPDPRVDDYLTGAQVIVQSQIAATGAICPMSQYTRTWLRDCGGPVRFLARTGHFDAARGIIDYLWLGALVEGGLRNSYRADLDPSLLAVLDAPDWASQPVMDGRTRAESPSYIPMMYGWYVAASGDASILDGRLPMLEHALMKQEFRGDLLPFSGDETFRTAMAIAHGLPVDESFEEGYLSSNSSFLWVAAARVLAELAAHQRDEPRAALLAARADVVAAAADAAYLLPGGAYAPYVTEEDFVPAPAPYEDVNTKPIWAGTLPATGTAAVDNLVATIAALGGDDGILVSPLPASYAGWMGLPIEEGIYTGMSPGYFLQNTAATRHPAAEAAFNALQHHAAPGGSTPEYAVLDGPYPLQLMYDPSGGEPADYTARYRPWEGAIVADAALEYLFGIRQDADAGTLGLSIALPNGWAWSEARGIRVGETRLDLRVEQVGGRWTLRLTHAGGPAVGVDVDLPWSSTGPDAAAALDGIPVGSTVAATPWGAETLRLDRFVLEPGSIGILEIDAP